MATFVLVHGSMHGGWCWRYLARELEPVGHRVIAPDLPCEDPNADVSEYANTVLAAMDTAGVSAADGPVVMVGHSLGGSTIPVVAARRPVQYLVYLCCAPLEPRETALDAFGGAVMPHWDAAKRVAYPDGTYGFDADSARDLYYHDCPDDVAAWAAGLLRRQGMRPVSEPLPVDELPSVPASVILAADDRAVDLGWATDRARRLLGVEPVVLPGGHSPFLARPAELARCLLAVTSL